MPEELQELYRLYQQELETREENEKDTKMLVADAEKILRVKKFSYLHIQIYTSSKCSNQLIPFVHSDSEHVVFKTRAGIRR